jgi:isopentenyl diphosphate isomerase/L-lactate dehydrogenase-like FMN-dependent dehydrogenase
MKRRARAALTRRSFLTGASAFPAFWSWALAAETPPPSVLYRREPPPITSAEQVLDVMGFEPLAEKALPPAHFAYIATGVDDDLTVARNHEAFAHYEIRARRFVDVSHIDTARQVFGVRWASPLYLSAVGSMRAFHPEGELAVARAAKARTTQLMLSTGSSIAVEQIATAAGAPFWQQLYPTDDWAVTTEIVRRAQSAGCSAIVLTLDSHIPHRNNETLKRAALADNRPCVSCHRNNSHDMWLKSPMFDGLDVSRVTGLLPPDLTPAYLDRLRAQVKGRLILKGVVTAEDAALALEHGADGVIVSNHGGRNEETLRATIDCLPEVVSAVRGRVPVFLDGGVRRGTDIFKAVALGATGVGIGRPEAWGLAAFGQPGVEAVLDILNRELKEIMIQAGTPALVDIAGARVLRTTA